MQPKAGRDVVDRTDESIVEFGYDHTMAAEFKEFSVADWLSQNNITVESQSDNEADYYDYITKNYPVPTLPERKRTGGRGRKEVVDEENLRGIFTISFSQAIQEIDFDALIAKFI